MISNFTFRFPPNTGFMYHVPTFAEFDDDSSAKWTTNFKNGKHFHIQLRTSDYIRLAFYLIKWVFLAKDFEL